MNRQEVENKLEERFLNYIVRYRAITDVEFVGKIDSISYWNDVVIFNIDNERFTCDLDWLSENMITL